MATINALPLSSFIFLPSEAMVVTSRFFLHGRRNPLENFCAGIVRNLIVNQILNIASVEITRVSLDYLILGSLTTPEIEQSH